GCHSSSDPEVYTDSVRQAAVFPCQLLHNRPRSCSSDLYARHGVETVPRSCGLSGNRSSGFFKRSCTSMRGKWPLGKRGFGIMKIQILSFPEQLSSEGTSFEVSHLLWGT